MEPSEEDVRQVKDFEMPSEEQINKICIDVDNYAIRKCKEEGFPWFISFLVIEKLFVVGETFMRMYDLLGPDAMAELGEAIEHMNMSEMLEEAERTLKEE